MGPALLTQPPFHAFTVSPVLICRVDQLWTEVLRASCPGKSADGQEGADNLGQLQPERLREFSPAATPWELVAASQATP
jgi:hypothetical protein